MTDQYFIKNISITLSALDPVQDNRIIFWFLDIFLDLILVKKKYYLSSLPNWVMLNFDWLSVLTSKQWTRSNSKIHWKLVKKLELILYFALKEEKLHKTKRDSGELKKQWVLIGAQISFSRCIEYTQLITSTNFSSLLMIACINFVCKSEAVRNAERIY